MVAAYLHRGLAVGLMAGLLAGLFAFFVGEPALDRAVALEEASADTHHDGNPGRSHDHPEEEVFSRGTQKVGLFFATGLSGATAGGIFGLAFAFFRDRLSSRRDLVRSASLAGVAFCGVVLIPFLKYPANPPSVGDPSTIGTRTIAYFVLIGLSLLAIYAAWQMSRTLREQGTGDGTRRVVVGAGLVVVVAALFLALPAAPSAGDFPQGLLWGFRLAALGTQAVLWAGIGLFFGLLTERANRAANRAGDQATGRGVAF